MKFKTHNTAAEYINPNGCSLQGYLQATHAEIEMVFGPAEQGEADDKVSLFWVIRFEDGTIATVYDWMTRVSQLQPYGWHIGGLERKAVLRIHDAFREVHGFKTRAVAA